MQQNCNLTEAKMRNWLIIGSFVASTTVAFPMGPRIHINENFPGLEKVHSNPDVFVIKDFLDSSACDDLIACAKKKNMQTSPVAYAGWTTDFKDLLELAAKGPVTWLAIVGAWIQTKDDSSASQLTLFLSFAQDYLVLLLVSIIGIGGFVWSRTGNLKSQRTSTSTILDDPEDGAGGIAMFLNRAVDLLGDGEQPSDIACFFEAPTVIRYENGQVLKPHFDANRSAETEDANRGGQTLATLLLYLNDVKEGGLTRFGKISADPPEIRQLDDNVKLVVQPRLGDALLFFPADAQGNFDERMEHEGCPAIDEKWIARIWRHKNRVPPPFGLSDEALLLL